MADTYSFLAALRDARDQLLEADVSATLDPRELVLPGVWIKLDALVGPVLSGGVAGQAKAQVTVYCAVAATDPERVYEALQVLVDATTAVIPAMSMVRHVSLALPAGGTPAPALSYTHDLLIEGTPSP